MLRSRPHLRAAAQQQRALQCHVRQAVHVDEAALSRHQQLRVAGGHRARGVARGQAARALRVSE
jgi:hypothetical protein